MKNYRISKEKKIEEIYIIYWKGVNSFLYIPFYYTSLTLLFLILIFIIFIIPYMDII